MAYILDLLYSFKIMEMPMTTNNVIDFEQYKAKKNKFKNLGLCIQS